MAANVTVPTSGATATFKTDDIGGIETGVSKIQVGAAGVDGGLISPTNGLPANVAQIGGSALAIGQAAMAASVPVVIASNQSAVTTTQTPATSGGSSLGKVLAAGSTNATSLKGSAGQIYSYQFTNTNAALRYVHFYNKATAPTVGTDVPVFTVAVPIGGSVTWSDLNGLPFATGIAYSITTGAADNDSGAATANDIIGLITYK